MSKRAQKLAKYLEDVLGWNIYTAQNVCPNRNCIGYGEKKRHKFCQYCGKKLKKDELAIKKTDKEIEKALKETIDKP